MEQYDGLDRTLDADDDDTFYIENDNMGESSFQFFCVHGLVDHLRYFLELSGRQAFVAGNQFVHLQKGDSQANIAPDVYVIPDEQLADDEVRSWKLWEHGGKGPCLAIEIVSDEPDEARKDYGAAMLDKYQRMGVTELFRYDPYGAGRRLGAERRRVLTHWVRQPDGTLQEQPLRHPGRARSTVFDFWLVHAPPRSLLLGVGPEGEGRFPTRAEALARRAEEESRRAQEEARRAAEHARLAEEESRRAEEEAARAEEQARLAEQESRRAEEESRRAADAEARLQEALAELERLKAAR